MDKVKLREMMIKSMMTNTDGLRDTKDLFSIGETAAILMSKSKLSYAETEFILRYMGLLFAHGEIVTF